MRSPLALTTILLAACLSCLAPAAAAALQTDATTPDEATREAMTEAIEGSTAFEEACADASEAPEAKREVTPAHFYEGRFSSAAHPGMAVDYMGCAGRWAAFLSKREDGWQVDALNEVQAMPQCLRLRPKPAEAEESKSENPRDVLVCAQTTRAEGGGTEGEVVAFRVRDAAVSEQTLTAYFSPLPCPSGRYRAVRPVEWRRWSYPDTDAPPRLGILLKVIDAEIPDEYMDACQAEKKGFDPAEAGNSHHQVVAADLRTDGHETPRFDINTRLGDFCSKRNIREVVSSKSDAIRHCYETRLSEHPDLSGKVLTQWKIRLDGSTDAVRVTKSTINDEKVEDCIREVIDGMEFEKPDGGVCLINYPFVFHAKESNGSSK